MTQTIKTNPSDLGVVEKDLAIRKLTPRECGRLQGVRDDDITKMSTHLSNMQQYHCYGDSICISVLMAIFGKMTDIDYETKIRELYETGVKNNVWKGKRKSPR